MGSASRASSRPFVFTLSGRTPILELPRPDALALLEWLGLGRPDFGAIEVNILLPLCRRRLWPEPRNLGPLRTHVAALAAALTAASETMVHFG